MNCMYNNITQREGRRIKKYSKIKIQVDEIIMP